MKRISDLSDSELKELVSGLLKTDPELQGLMKNTFDIIEKGMKLDREFAVSISEKFNIPFDKVFELVVIVRKYRIIIASGSLKDMMEYDPDTEIKSIQVVTNHGTLNVDMTYFTNDLVDKFKKILLKYDANVTYIEKKNDKSAIDTLFDMIVDFFNNQPNLVDFSRHYAIGLFQIHFRIESGKYINEDQFNARFKVGEEGSAQDWKHYLAERVRSRIETRRKYNPNL